jgi:flavodoxin I
LCVGRKKSVKADRLVTRRRATQEINLFKILIVYYSHTGNTERMAKAIAEGARTVQGVEVDVKRYESPQRLIEFDAVLIGAPTYHHTMTHNIKNFFEKVAFHSVNLKGKTGAAFGSYGWSGEAPKLVLEIMKSKFEVDIVEPPLLIKYTSNGEGLQKCRKLGKTIADGIRVCHAAYQKSLRVLSKSLFVVFLFFKMASNPFWELR